MSQTHGTPTTVTVTGDGASPDYHPEYLICQQRGHESDGTALTIGYGPTTYTCKFCNTQYYHTEPELVELNPPAAKKEKETNTPPNSKGNT